MATMVASPIVEGASARFLTSVPTARIIKEYAEQLSVDVSSYLDPLESVGLYECLETGYRFFHPALVQGDMAFYENLYSNHPTRCGASSWKAEFDVGIDLISEGDVVLDVGCNDGAYLAEARKVAKRVVGIEPNRVAYAHCERLGLQVFNESIDRHVERYQAEYDVVSAFQVIEHIYNVSAFMKAAVRLLKPGGKLIVAAPNNEPYFLGYDVFTPLNLPPHHMGLWNRSVFLACESIFPIRIMSAHYDRPSSVVVHAYYLAKYLAQVQTQKHHHSVLDWVRIALAACVAVPYTLIKKATVGIRGNYITVVFQKIGSRLS